MAGEAKFVPLVAHVIYELGVGGLENGLVNIINRMPPERYRHVIICITGATDFAQRITAPSVEIVVLRKKRGHDWLFYWRFFKALRRLRPNILHTRNLAALELQFIGALLPFMKRVHGEHGRDIHDLDGTKKKYVLLRKLVRPLISHYVAVSADLARWLEAVVGVAKTQISTIYNGVDTGTFFPDTARRANLLPDNIFPEGALIIGTVGRLATVKDQGTLIDAFGLLKTQLAGQAGGLSLLIVGDGPMREGLVDQVKRLGLERSVWLAGSRDDVPDLLRAMNVFVLPSLAEGVSNTLLEAMATGLPVIATSVGGNPELITQHFNGLLVSAQDPIALAEAMRSMVTDHPKRELMASNGYARVTREFNWSRTVEQYMAVYDNLMGIEHSRTSNSHRHLLTNDQ